MTDSGEWYEIVLLCFAFSIYQTQHLTNFLPSILLDATVDGDSTPHEPTEGLETISIKGRKEHIKTDVVSMVQTKAVIWFSHIIWFYINGVYFILIMYCNVATVHEKKSLQRLNQIYTLSMHTYYCPRLLIGSEPSVTVSYASELYFAP